MSALAAMVDAVPSELAGHRAAEPGPGRFDAVGSERGRDVVLEAAYEGYLAHYHDPRALVGMDADLRLLAGDALYALGLARLAERGDLEAVRELADLISASARAEAEARPEAVHDLWEDAARRLAGVAEAPEG